jgi:hypothetical protein
MIFIFFIENNLMMMMMMMFAYRNYNKRRLGLNEFTPGGRTKTTLVKTTYAIISNSFLPHQPLLLLPQVLAQFSFCLMSNMGLIGLGLSGNYSVSN